jgi:hypothetical protein
MNATTPTLVEGELRIYDLDLARHLGYARPTQMRELIERHLESLNKISILLTIRKNTEGKRGRPANEYWLNRKQAIFITAKSDMPLALEITIEIIRRFDAYEGGAVLVGKPLNDQPELTSDDRSAVGGIIK